MSDEDLGKFWNLEDLKREEEKRHREEPGRPNGATGPADAWPDPDMGVSRLRRRDPPEFPIHVFGPDWGLWIVEAAQAAACAPDYVALPLLACASTLIGNARWAAATSGWVEPPHLWSGVVGDSGEGKSPGADCLMRHVIPEIERRMIGDFPDRHREWERAVDLDKAAAKNYED